MAACTLNQVKLFRELGQSAQNESPAVNFINILHTNFSYKSRFLCTCNQRKAAETTFIQKSPADNVDEIDT